MYFSLADEFPQRSKLVELNAILNFVFCLWSSQVNWFASLPFCLRNFKAPTFIEYIYIYIYIHPFSAQKFFSFLFVPFGFVVCCRIKQQIGSTYLPAFIGNVRVWFAQLTSYFVANKISTEHQQLHILFSAFFVSLMPTIKDIITGPLPGFTNKSVKREVLLRASLSTEKRFQTLINDEHLGDRTPSQMLRHVRELAEDEPADSALIKQLFFSRLSQNVQAILVPMVVISSADYLATSADRIVDIVRQPAFHTTPPPQSEVFPFSPTPTQHQSILGYTSSPWATHQRGENIECHQISIAQTFAIAAPPPNKQIRMVFLSHSFLCSGT